MSTIPPRVVDYKLPKTIEVPKFKGDCLGLPTDWWFPPPRQGAEVLKKMRLAFDICNSCHAKQECLDFALSNPNIHGIWGATTPKMRSRILQKLRHAKLKTK